MSQAPWFVDSLFLGQDNQYSKEVPARAIIKGKILNAHKHRREDTPPTFPVKNMVGLFAQAQTFWVSHPALWSGLVGRRWTGALRGAELAPN